MKTFNEETCSLTFKHPIQYFTLNDWLFFTVAYISWVLIVYHYSIVCVLIRSPNDIESLHRPKHSIIKISLILLCISNIKDNTDWIRFVSYLDFFFQQCGLIWHTSTRFYCKSVYLNIPIVKFQFLISNISSVPSYGHKYQLIHYTSHVHTKWDSLTGVCYLYLSFQSFNGIATSVYDWCHPKLDWFNNLCTCCKTTLYTQKYFLIYVMTGNILILRSNLVDYLVILIKNKIILFILT